MHVVPMTAISVQNFITFESCSMAKVVRRKTMYKTYGIFPIRRRRRSRTRILSVRMTEQMTFSHFLNYWNNYSLQNSTEGKGRVRFTDGYIDFKDLF